MGEIATRAQEQATCELAAGLVARLSRYEEPRVLLVDLDNIGMPSPGLAEAHLRALSDAAGDYAFAVAAGRDHAYLAFLTACQSVGMTALETPPVRNSADLALLTIAQELAEAGVRDFVIVSGDHAFAQLPGRIDVVMPSGRSVSDDLARVARSINRVELARSNRNARSRGSRNARRRRAREGRQAEQ